MSDDARTGLCGCLIFIAIALLVGVGLRSQNFTQFLVMGAEVVVGILALSWGIRSLSDDGCWSKLWGLWLGSVSVVLAISVGNFLITGNYDRSIEIAKRIWSQPTPTPATSAKSDATPATTLTPTPQPTFTLTPTPQPTPTSTRTATPISPPKPPEADDWPWLYETEVNHELVTEALNKIWKSPSQDAVTIADDLRTVRETASDEGKRAAGLLIAVALERTEDLSTARTAYKEIVDEAKGDPYATSATIRLRRLTGILEPNPEDIEPTKPLDYFSMLSEQSSKPENEEKELTEPLDYFAMLSEQSSSPESEEKIYATIVNEPEAEVWFLLSDQWIWDITRRAASRALVNMRADRLSFRFFQFLRLQSPFPTPYAYMFILLALTIGVRVLALPLSVRTAKLAVQMRRMRPEIEMIKRVYADDPATMQQRMSELYLGRGLNIWGGCASSIVDLIFVIWVLVALNSFSPQLVLDGAKLLWIPDVTQGDLSILLIWLVVSVVQTMIVGASQQGGMSRVQTFFGVLFGNAFFVAIARYWNWPAYLFVFWILLSVVGLLINRILMAIFSARKQVV